MSQAVFRSRVETVVQRLMQSVVTELVQLLEETYCSLQTEVHQQSLWPPEPPGPKADGGRPFPGVGEVLVREEALDGEEALGGQEALGGEEAQALLWRRPISPSLASADEGEEREEEEEGSLPAPSTSMGQTFLAETVVYIKEEEPEIFEFEFEGCGEVPFPSQPDQDHTKTNANASWPQIHDPTQTRTYKPERIPELTCNFCNKTIKKKLVEHQRKCKSRHKVLTCQICGRQCQRSSDLSRHLMGHDGKKPYSCSYCGKQFAHNKSCRTHERRDHIAMGYRCSDCGKTFREREQRDAHECVKLKGDCTFYCSECMQGFSRQYLLKKHQLEFHRKRRGVRVV